MKEYSDLNIHILPAAQEPGETDQPETRPTRYIVEVDSRMAGEDNKGTFEVPVMAFKLAGVVVNVEQTSHENSAIDDSTTDAGSNNRGIGNVHKKDLTAKTGASAKEFGESLYEALFTGDVRSALDKTTSAAHVQNAGTRIRLIIDLKDPGMAELASLPWELMRPKNDDPLVVSVNTTLVRSLDVAKPSEPRPFKPPLRIMAVMSNPNGTPELKLEEERARIEKEWKLLPGVEVHFGSPVVDVLCKQLRAEEFHVIHFMGHGEFDAATGGMLLLEREPEPGQKHGSPHCISGEDFAIMLADEPLRLVFLNACKTGKTGAQSGAHPFAGVATALIRKGIPAVVAMQFPISDDAAIDFAKTFYECIVEKIPVDAAVAEARKALRCARPAPRSTSSTGAPVEYAEWATPVLYMRARDGMLFAQSQDDESPARSAAVVPSPDVAVSATPAADDPWGPGDGDRVFLAVTTDTLRPLRRRLYKELTRQGIRVIDVNKGPPPPHEPEEHAAAVEALVRAADLCVHLLGDQPGESIGDVPPEDTDTAPTYPWEQCRIGLLAARSQLILLPDIDIDSIEDPDYKAYVNSLIARPRSAERFELVRTGKQQMAAEIIAKLQRLKETRMAEQGQETPGETVSAAFVDAHRSDRQPAEDIEDLLNKHNIKVVLQTSNTSPIDALSEFDVNLAKYPLYVLVAGQAAPEWIENRELAAMKSASRTRAQVVIGRYRQTSDTGNDDARPEQLQFEVVAAMNECDVTCVEALIGDDEALTE